MSILYSEERDVNFDKFYDFKSAQIISRMVKLELEAIKLANEKAKDSVVQNFKSGTNGSVSYSPKVQRASQLNSDMPYSPGIQINILLSNILQQYIDIANINININIDFSKTAISISISILNF